MQIINNFELQIFNELTELRRMSAWLHSACASMALSESIRSNLDLCANEAVANIINYAYQDHGRHEIYLRLGLMENQVLCLTIQDDGIAFDPFETLPPTPFDNIENAKIGGLGIHLIRSLMDECNYRRSEDKNIITLSANLIPTPAHSLAPICSA
jgi:anti-sigma regulatory factor (Ser/Thr protein kinase)